MLVQKSLDHLKENKMTYIEHLLFASGHGIRCIGAGLLLIIHSIIPAVFPKVGSKLVFKLNKSFTDHQKYLT